MEGASGFSGFHGLPGSNIGNNSDTINGSINQCTVREQDRFMPIANVIRIMRKVIPSHAKISDDAKETIQECVSEFISFITSEANDRCQREQRKTITAEDVLWAMDKLGFDNYIEPLTSYLHKYREVEGDHRGSIRGEPLPLKRTASAANLAPLQPALPLPMAGNATEAYGLVPSPMSFHHHHHHHQFGVYGDHVMGPGYYFGMSYGAGAAGDGGAAGSSQHSAAAFDPYSAYK